MNDTLEETRTAPELDLGDGNAGAGSELVPDELPWWQMTMESQLDLLH